MRKALGLMPTISAASWLVKPKTSPRMYASRCSRLRQSNIPCVHPILISSTSRRFSTTSSGLGSIGSQPLVELLGELLERQLFPFRTALARGEQIIDGHAIHPRRKGTLAAERTEVGHDPNEDLLCGVLGVRRVPQHPHREVVNLVLNALHQRFEGRPIAFFSAFDQLCQFRSIKDCCHCRHIVSRFGSRTRPTDRSALPLEATCVVGDGYWPAGHTARARNKIGRSANSSASAARWPAKTSSDMPG